MYFICFAFPICYCTCVTHITEANARDAISMSPTVVGTRLRDVDPVQGERRSISVHAALLEPAEACFTVEMRGRR